MRIVKGVSSTSGSGQSQATKFIRCIFEAKFSCQYQYTEMGTKTFLVRWSEKKELFMTTTNNLSLKSHFDPHFEGVRGGVEPWWMARWKARAEFLLSVIELLFTARAMLGQTELP